MASGTAQGRTRAKWVTGQRAPAGPIARTPEVTRDRRRSGAQRAKALRRRRRGEDGAAGATLVVEGESVPRRPREDRDANAPRRRLYGGSVERARRAVR